MKEYVIGIIAGVIIINIIYLNVIFWEKFQKNERKDV